MRGHGRRGAPGTHARHRGQVLTGSLIITRDRRHVFLAERGRAGIAVEYLGDRLDGPAAVEPWQGWAGGGNRWVAAASRHL